jgi:transposase-like protein
MYVKLNGEMVYLWRAVDQEGKVLERFVTRTRDKGTALTFMKKALKRHGRPEAITTDCAPMVLRWMSSVTEVSRKPAAAPTTGSRTRTCRSDDESVPWPGSDG